MDNLTKIESFWAWIDQEREKRQMSWFGLERASGLSNGGITKRRDALDEPSFKVCLGLAKGLALPVEEVMRRAGILPKDVLGTIGNDPSLKEVLAISRQLSDREKDNLLQYARFLLSRARERDA